MDIEIQIERMRELLILRGHNGAFAGPNPISYWSSEEVMEKFQELYQPEYDMMMSGIPNYQN